MPSTSIKQGQPLTKENLNVYFYVGGSLSDPFNVTYTLFDSTSGTDEVIGLPDRFPIKFSTGSFYAPWTVPNDEPAGLHKIKWRYKDSASSLEKIDTEEFSIIPACAAVEQVYPDMIRYLIQQLRTKLRDANPDRDYHFAPPEKEQTIAGFTRVRGYRWPDEALYYHLIQAANYVNLFPPDTDFQLESYPAVWQPILLQQAMVYALWDLSILWINEEFSYSLNGISLDIARSDKYQGAATSIQDTVNTQLEMGKKRIHIIKGMAQNRYIFSRGAALGPWCLSGNSLIKYGKQLNQIVKLKDAYDQKLKYTLSTDFKSIFENEILNILYNGIQELYTLKFETHEIICTKKHRFFDEHLKEFRFEKLTIGQKIWVCNEENILILEEVKSKEFYGEDDTYDIEMKEPYKNYIANGIIVHNSSGQNAKRWIQGGSTRIRMGF